MYTLTASALPVGDPWSSLITTDPISISITIPQAVPTVHESAPSSGIYTGSAFTATATVAGINNVFSSSLEGVNPTFTYYLGTGTSGTNLGSRRHEMPELTPSSLTTPAALITPSPTAPRTPSRSRKKR